MTALRRSLARLRIATAFLTRLPIRAPDAGPEEVGRSLASFPIVGLGIGVALLVLAHLLAQLVRPDLLAALLVAALAAITGGLHLDGLADLFDGLGGGRGDRARTLEIMRDASIGAHGATALILVLLIKTIALATILGGSGASKGARALVLFPVVGRWLAALLIALFPYAREEGLGRAFVDRAGTREVAIATLVTSAALTWGGSALFVAALPAALVALGLGAWLTRRLGGLTGDIYGAAIEIGETTFLVAATVLL